VRVGAVLRTSLTLLRCSGLHLLAGLALVAAAILFGALLYTGVIFYSVTGALGPMTVSEGILTALGIVGPFLVLVATAILLVFGAGLLHMLVQRTSGGTGGLGYAFAVFRRFGWLFVTALFAAVGFVLLGFPWVLPAIVALALLIYTAPLVLEEGLPPHRAAGRSADLVRAYGPLSHFVLVTLGVALSMAAWGVTYLALGDFLGEDWMTEDAGAWTTDLHGVAGLALTQDVLLLSLSLAWSFAATVGVFAVLAAAMYREVTGLEAAGAPAAGSSASLTPANLATPPPAPAPSVRVPRAVWPLAGTIAGVGLLALAAWFVWWIASPEYDPLGDHSVASGARVTMQNGLTLTVPEATTGDDVANYSTYRRYPDWLKVGENTSVWAGDDVGWKRSDEFNYNEAGDAGDWLWAFSFYDDDSSWLASWTRQVPVALKSADGTIEVRWKDGMTSAIVITRLPGHDAGWLRISGDKDAFGDVGAVSAKLGRIWREFSIAGAELPTGVAATER
jgi:hypothetical protein